MEVLKVLIVIFIFDRLTYFFHAISIPNGPFRGIVGMLSGMVGGNEERAL